ncbi:MAG: 30S ribosomal protein S2 [Erysipelotrichaceae bacterium]|nr:30S ribosomal protein S2 [Erysipelotrichaceae bacterium]
MSVVTMRKLLESGVHYGHQTRRWDPRMKQNIYAAKNGVHIINLEKTMTAWDSAYEAMKASAEKCGRVLFVGTKKQAQAIVMEEALRSGSFYVTTRWLGGTLTNYRTIQKRIRRLLEIEQMEENGGFENMTKKEVAQVNKEKDKLENFLGGIKEMKKLPDAVFVVDPMEDRIAVLEAQKLRIPVFGIVDTNCNPAIVDYPIPGNDDAVKAIKILTGVMADAIVETKAGELEFAYVKDEQPEITMEDVIVNVQEVAAENERRRRARYEEKRQQQNARNAARRPRREAPRTEAAAEAAAQPAPAAEPETAAEQPEEKVEETVSE